MSRPSHWDPIAQNYEASVADISGHILGSHVPKQGFFPGGHGYRNKSSVQVFDTPAQSSGGKVSYFDTNTPTAAAMSS